jgi:MFS family permease
VRQLPDFDWFFTPSWLRKYGLHRFISVPLLDRVGLHYFTLQASLNAVMSGVFTLSAVVMAKTLGANEFQVALFTALGPIALLIGIFGSELVQDRDKRPLIFWVGMISRASILLFLFVRDLWSFIAISAIFSVLNAFLTPAVSAMWQANISSEFRNRLWGLMGTVMTVITMAAAYISGVVLDHDPWSYRWMYAIAGILGMAGIYVLAASPLRGLYKLTAKPTAPTFGRTVIQPMRNLVELLKQDRNYLHFEAAFFLYGVAFMLLCPALPMYMVNVAKMSYEQSGIATGLLGSLGMVFAAVIWGRLMDHIGPTMLCAIIFAILAFFPAVLLLGPTAAAHGISLVYVVYLGYIIFGLGMSGIHIAWSLGPIVFAGDRDASTYLGVHVTLTGLRGSVAPMLGAIGLSVFGYATVFAVAAIFFLLGTAGMLHLNIKLQRQKALG